jgi:hypothetical protein
MEHKREETGKEALEELLKALEKIELYDLTDAIYYDGYISKDIINKVQKMVDD